MDLSHYGGLYRGRYVHHGASYGAHMSQLRSHQDEDEPARGITPTWNRTLTGKLQSVSYDLSQEMVSHISGYHGHRGRPFHSGRSINEYGIFG